MNVESADGSALSEFAAKIAKTLEDGFNEGLSDDEIIGNVIGDALKEIETINARLDKIEESVKWATVSM